MNKIRIGIDPDVTASGIAIFSTERINDKQIKTTKGWLLVPKNKSFVDLINFFTTDPIRYILENSDVVIKLEAGWLNKAMFRGIPEAKKIFAEKGLVAALSYAGANGMKVGRNHQVGHCLKEVLEAKGFKVDEVRPTQKKKNRRFVEAVIGHKLVTNQEQRDAIMIVVQSM